MIYKHQKKADALDIALQQNGWRKTTNLFECSAALFDTDLGRLDLLEKLHNYGLKLLIYPHQARPNVLYACGNFKPFVHTDAHFVSGPGHEDVMRILGYEKPIYDIGWNYCEKKQFQPSPNVKNVLLGLLHPNHAIDGKGAWLHEVDKRTNRTALERLMKASREMDFRLSVRYLGDIQENGIEREFEGVTWIRGKVDNSFEQIDNADLVVGTQTFAYIAVARGKPTLFMDEHIPPKVGNSQETIRFMRGYQRVRDLMAFPLDLNTTGNVNALIERASQTDKDIADWRNRMIGEQFDPKKFTEIVEKVSYFQP
jgi:hypothetical protein